MSNNPLLQLQALGQSIWLDFLRRGMMASGQLHQLIEEDGLQGVTANPSIFEKAIAGSHDYDNAVRALAQQGKTLIRSTKRWRVAPPRDSSSNSLPTMPMDHPY